LISPLFSSSLLSITANSTVNSKFGAQFEDVTQYNTIPKRDW